MSIIMDSHITWVVGTHYNPTCKNKNQTKNKSKCIQYYKEKHDPLLNNFPLFFVTISNKYWNNKNNSLGINIIFVLYYYNITKFDLRNNKKNTIVRKSIYFYLPSQSITINSIDYYKTHLISSIDWKKQNIS